MAKKQIGEVDFNVEFNDSVLSTKTWSNPRYDGCETKTQELNKFTQGDITYGKTPSIQKYTRNIYIGDQITQASSSSDLNLTPFSGFSYLISTKTITVNEDDTISQTFYDGSNLNQKNGYYRQFTEDFNIGKNCQVLLLNENITNSLKESYNIYFTGGKLEQVLYYFNGSGSINQVLPQLATSAQPTFGKFFPFNQGVLNTAGDYESGSKVTVFDNKSFDSISSTISPKVYTNSGSISTLMGEIQTNIEASPYNRFFLTLSRPQGNTKQYNSSINYIIPREDSVENLFVPTSVDKTPTALATFEIQQVLVPDPYIGVNGDKFLFSNKFTPTSGFNVLGVDYYVSKFDDSVPSILVKLEKSVELPNGLIAGQLSTTISNEFYIDPGIEEGPKFVIIPDNLHPYIKENIKYFLIKAGLASENTSLTINPQNRQLS